MDGALLLFAPAAIAVAAAVWWIARAYAGAGPSKPAPVLIGCGVGALAVLGLYLALGRPSQPDEPAAGRMAALEKRAATAPESLGPGDLLALLDARAKADPSAFQPYVFKGQILAEQGRDAEAARAFASALERAPDSPDAALGLARALVAQEGVVSPQALELFKRVAVLSPHDPVPWLYQALAARQAGRLAESEPLWRETLKRLPSDDPRHAMVTSMLEELKAKPPQAGR
jgi:cytochrome c-type biogenesis protein CcmH/NrfG